MSMRLVEDRNREKPVCSEIVIGDYKQDCMVITLPRVTEDYITQAYLEFCFKRMPAKMQNEIKNIGTVAYIKERLKFEMPHVAGSFKTIKNVLTEQLKIHSRSSSIMDHLVEKSEFNLDEKTYKTRSKEILKHLSHAIQEGKKDLMVRKFLVANTLAEEKLGKKLNFSKLDELNEQIQELCNLISKEMEIRYEYTDDIKNEGYSMLKEFLEHFFETESKIDNNDKDTQLLRVFQFRIDLKYTEQTVWRRVQVPDNFTFYDLHFLIQELFEWDNDHLHEFSRTTNRNNLGGLFRNSDRVAIGMKEDPSGSPMDSGDGILDEKKEIISNWFDMENKTMDYVYDFGDNWQHRIKLEKILMIDKNEKYPKLLKSKGISPKEDGGDYDSEEPD